LFADSRRAILIYLRRPEQKSNKFEKRQTWAPIRFLTLDHISSDSYQCTSAGATVQIGDTSTGACSSSVTNDCTYTCTAADVPSNYMKNFILTVAMPAVENIYEGILQVMKMNNGEKKKKKKREK
jgi:hypothetical protein